MPDNFCALREYETRSDDYCYYGYSKCRCANCGNIVMFERFETFQKPQPTLYDQDS